MDITLEKLIVRLIKDDLVSYKLLNGLEKLGLTPSDYYLDLGENILLLMGFVFPKQDRVYGIYSKLKMQVLATNIEGPKKAHYLAQKIYKELDKIER